MGAHYVEFAEQLGLLGEVAGESEVSSDNGSNDDDLVMDQLLEVAMLDTRPIVMLDLTWPDDSGRLPTLHTA